MPNRNIHRVPDRIRVELIEADVEMAFGLVDDARDALQHGDREFGTSALTDAERVLTDIEDRLAQLGAQRSAPFGPLLEELRKSVGSARAECT